MSRRFPGPMIVRGRMRCESTDVLESFDPAA